MDKNDLKVYVEKNIDLPDYEIAQACDIMDRMRCPLHLVGNSVYDTLQGLVEDFISDNELPEDWFENCEYLGDYEQLFFDLDIF